MKLARGAAVGQLLICAAAVVLGVLACVAGVAHDVTAPLLDPAGRTGSATGAGALAAIAGGAAGLALTMGATLARAGRRRPLVLAELAALAIALGPTVRLDTTGDVLLPGAVWLFDGLGVAVLFLCVRRGPTGPEGDGTRP